MRRNATSPIVVTSAHVHPEWTLELTGHNERSPRSRASKARESTSAQLARTIDFAEASSAANPADDDPVSPSKASSKAATAPGTMLRFMCGPPNQLTRRVREALPRLKATETLYRQERAVRGRRGWKIAVVARGWLLSVSRCGTAAALYCGTRSRTGALKAPP